MIKHILEAAAQGIADETSKPPFLYQLGPKEARKVLDDVQAAPIDMSKVDEKWITVPAEVGDVQVRIVKPVGVVGDLHRLVRSWRRLDPRQRRNARPARPRTGRRCQRRGRVR